MKTINSFEYDEVYPFTNIFWGGSLAAYGFPVIGFAGAYKQIEEHWSAWMWKFSQLLYQLDAVEAHVNLNCIVGDFHWTLQPKLHFEQPTAYYRTAMTGQVWGIVEALEPDLYTDLKWRAFANQLTEQGWDDWELLERWVKAERRT